MANIKNLDLNLLRALDALLDTRSVTRAAQQLGLTQPAVSGMILRLRDAFQDPLFVRVQRGIEPTPRALALALPLKAALRDIEGLMQPAAFDPARADMTVSIAATDYAQRVVLLPFLAALRHEAPAIRLSVRPVEINQLAQQMERGMLDMALITPDMAGDSLRTYNLFDEAYVCVLRQGHPALAKPLDLVAFCALDHAIMSHDGTRFSGATDQRLRALGLERRVVLAAPSFVFLIDSLRRSDLCAMLPRRLVAGMADLVLQAPPLAIPGFSKVLAWHDRTHADPAMMWLRGKLSEVLT